MSWLTFAFAGPVLWAISTHLDKYLVDRYFSTSNVAVLLMFTALAGLVMLPFIWFAVPGVADVPVKSVLLIGFSGVLYLGALFFYLQALQSEEASVVAPLFQAAPLFGFILGYLVLGEVLSPMQMAGGLLIVCGTLFVSVRFGSGKKHVKTRLIGLMLLCALSLAVTSVIFKAFAIQDEFWVTTFWLYLGEAVFGAILLAIPLFRRQFLALLRSNTVAVLAINGANEMINLGGGLSARYALLLAPLGLVQAVNSTTSLFVFAFGIALSVFFPSVAREKLSRREIVQKGLSALLVVAGLMLVNRQSDSPAP
jgi:drug/metabolite transporter (DMT)-like permease